MSNKIKLTQSEIERLATRVLVSIQNHHQFVGLRRIRVYGVPRGGVSAAMAVRSVAGAYLQLVDNLDDADCVIDDIVDSGRTKSRILAKGPKRPLPFFALIDKLANPELQGGWYVFPWEGSTEQSADDWVVRLLQFVGEDVKRGGLKETPNRVVKAWQQWCSGYHQDPADVLKVFEDGAEKHDQMITVTGIPIYSHCEHHLAAIFGTATISYIPNGKIVGLSKLSRLADIFARRLQVQERMTDQIADALFTHLKPRGVGVVIKARHLCMESRGICQQGHHTITTSLRGVIKDDASARAEFMRLV
jgi:GTP cyclohydrolase I